MTDELDGTWCPECGPGVRVDADGCCTDCGADATGPGSRRARVALSAEARLRGELAAAQDRVESLKCVIAAVDRVLLANGAVHASRAVAIENLVARLRGEPGRT